METIFILITVFLVLFVFYYNRLVRKKNEVDNATGSINAMLKNRYDLIPNLVDTVKSYMSHETEVLNNLTTMRTRALANNTSAKDEQKLNEDITKMLHQIMVSVENYPELKASNNFVQLQESWTDIEDRISASRRFYNNAVTDYNNAILTFPGNILARIMSYETKTIFEVSKEESANLNAKALFNN